MNVNEPFDLANKTEADCILSYRAEKGHRTSTWRKLHKYVNLQTAKYCILSEKIILEEIKKIERHQDCLTLIGKFLHVGGTATANQYVTEAVNLSNRYR